MNVLTTQILLTVATLGYSAVPAIFDLNRTHATNPAWVGHARFHVVWQVVSYIGIAAIGLCLIWSPGEDLIWRLWLAVGLASAAYIGFFCANFTQRIYGGAAYDPNGVLPIRVSERLSLEVNTTLFTIITAVLVAGAVFLARA
jgi:hypothetical protein